MSNVIIRKYFETKLKTFADAQVPPIKTAFEQSAFTKPANQATFFECWLAPANTINVSTDGSRKRYLGYFQINIWVKEGQGSTIADGLAQQLIGLFPVVPKDSAVSVEQPGCQHLAFPDASGYSITPVDFYYRFES